MPGPTALLPPETLAAQVVGALASLALRTIADLLERRTADGDDPAETLRMVRASCERALRTIAWVEGEQPSAGTEAGWAPGV